MLHFPFPFTSAASLLSGAGRVSPPRPHPQQLLGIPLRLHDAGQVRLAVETLSAVMADARDCARTRKKERERGMQE